MSLSLLDLVTVVGDACDLGNAAVFVGAGLSKAAGLPDWGELLETPRQESNVPNSSPEMVSDLPLLAEYILVEGQYTRTRLQDHMLARLASVANPTPMHRDLARLPVDQIWTTNYDPLIEQVTQDSRVISRDEDITSIGTSRRAIIKMHGSIHQGSPPGWASPPVITRSDYENYEADHRRTWAMLQSSYLSKTFLFLGFSFADPNVGILQRLSRIHGTATGNRHVTIMRRPPDAGSDDRRFHDLRVRDLENSGVRVHEIDDHNDLGPILTALVRRTRPPRLFIAGSDQDLGNHKECCDAIALCLADKTAWQLWSLGGQSGWRTSRVIARIRRAEGAYEASSLYFHFRRKEGPPPEMDERVGTAVFTDLEREPLVKGELAESRAVVVIGGGDRTREEIGWAESYGVGIVPLAASGGVAHEYWKRHAAAPPALGGQPTNRQTWMRLAAEDPGVAARAAISLLEQAMYSHGAVVAHRSAVAGTGNVSGSV